jgi:hypothetical protein
MLVVAVVQMGKQEEMEQMQLTDIKKHCKK